MLWFETIIQTTQWEKCMHQTPKQSTINYFLSSKAKKKGL